MITASFSIMAVGFTLGLMHALDADHVMAVSTLSSQKAGVMRTLRFCASWAIGHAGVLVTSGLLLFGLGWQLPASLQHVAELLVGLLLIGLGLYCFWRFRQQKLRLIQHSHDEITHYHWHVEGDVTRRGHRGFPNREGHAPVMVGVVHGLAGSAPALALVPAVSQGQLSWALIYLMVFSCGVMLSMLVFGLGLGTLQKYLKEKHLKWFHWQQHLIAGGSVILGGYWFSQAL
ncbi:MAG: sulfite exporter TauE/SafE family protein [Hahellaceae bacterium]|nr:sulfite exporter TauE/SafE family protein [Hahellaceae bacterium]MCP5170158.1 sulfite exporter TauE/SafE family protein [Hahellaceae bacterium]